MRQVTAGQTIRTVFVLLFFSAFLFSLTGWPAAALTPEEKLADPILEDRARALSKQLRCLVCQNQSIDDSDADLAKDLRREVRSLLQTGASDAAILERIQNSYGDYVLLRPPLSTQTLLLWLAPVLILTGGGLIIILGMRRPRPHQTAELETGRHKKKRADTQINQTGDNAKSQPALPVRHAAAAGVAITAAAGLLYGLYGRPDLPDQPLYKRTAELAQKQAETKAEIEALDTAFDAAQNAAAKHPDDITSWLQLALAAARTGNSRVEIDALQNALSLSNDAADIKAMIAEALSRAAGGQVTIPARQLINEILQVEPNEPRALFLWGLAAYQDEAYQLAIDRWAYLYQLSAPNAPWRERLEDSIRQAADDGGLPAPDLPEKTKASTSQGEADLSQISAAEQQAMIEGMVAGLAARLEDIPDDREGWLRLARSYKVLGRSDEQINALFRAAELDKSDIAVLIKLSELILKSGGSEQHARRIGKLFEQNEVSDKPRFQAHPQWLFFRGHFALSENNIPLARESWSKLLAGLPPDSELANLLTEKLASLP